jgi:hypothetical protein
MIAQQTIGGYMDGGSVFGLSTCLGGSRSQPWYSKENHFVVAAMRTQD